MANMTNLIKFYALRVMNGEMNIEEVPQLYRKKVKEYVEEHTNEHTSNND